MQLADSLGFPVTGTEFWVTIDVIKDGPLVTLQLPVINFQTGQFANDQVEIDFGLTPLVEGGYLYTVAGFLPEGFRPDDLVPRSIVAASNNGLSPVFSYAQPTDTLPNPPSGYIVQVTNAGELQVQSAGTFGNIIPAGPQILMPCSITYLAKPTKKLCKNFLISTGASNVTKFTGGFLDGAYRDSQVNDAFDGVVAYAWGDNSMEDDKTNNIMQAMVAVGKVVNGKVVMNPPVQLTNLVDANINGSAIFDHAVAINRQDPLNIVVSYRIRNAAGRQSCRAVSFDGGKTWPAQYDGITPVPNNGPIAPVVTGGNDNRGVSSDKYGNIWYSFTGLQNGVGPAYDPTTRPIFYVSTDKGQTFSLALIAPPVVDPINELYDYPQYCFGGDGIGNYGLWYHSSLFNFAVAQGDVYPTVGFLPITGLGSLGVPTFTSLTGLINSMILADLNASLDGRMWLQGWTDVFDAYTYISPQVLTFKSPGPIDQNYAGVWDLAVCNTIGVQYFFNGDISFPRGYFPVSPQGIIYDEKRQALYAIGTAKTPDYSQDIQIFFMISRDNGQTWSAPIDINTTNFANRGFQSMALDEVTGDLVFGFYDGRNDPTFQSVEYMGAIIPAKKLTKLVNAIPLSNPTFEVPSAA